MLVYANYVPLRSSDGLLSPLVPVAEWLSRKMRRRGSAAELLAGVESRGAQGMHLRSLSTTDRYPYLAAVELIHPDNAVSGRRWHSEIGLQQPSRDADVELTVLVQTSEVSARVTAQVSPGAPTFVRDLLTKCALSSAAIGGELRLLDDDDAEAFRHVLLDSSRAHPFVVVSPFRDGKYLADVEFLRNLLVGIAELVVIPPSADTFWLARGVGEEFVPYRGAVKILHSVRATGRPDVRTFTAEELLASGRTPARIAQEIFSWVLHRTNLPLSWKHVSPGRVREEQLRREMDAKRAQASSSGDAAAYTRFLEDYLKEQESATRGATDAKLVAEKRYDDLLGESEQAKREADAKIDALKYRLDQLAESHDDSPYKAEDFDEVSDAIAAAVKGDLTPAQCLVLLEHLFPSRITILPEAWTSARDSESFKYSSRLFALLYSLATDYWIALSNGLPDQEARKVFGAAYAPKESQVVSSNKGAKRRRTFSYAGGTHVMERHLKIGVKDSATETIRVHFEWFADRKRIVIGHCGPHIPFN